jgi:hypothetical protein
MSFFSKTLWSLLTVGLLLSTLEAKPKSASNATPKATPDPRKDPQVQKILSDLRPSYPHLSAAEIVRTSNHDLRRMYEHLYHAEGLSLLEAKQRAAVVSLKEN